MTGPSDDPLDAAALGQRRYLTLLFSDLSDSTQLGSTMDPEHYAEMLAAWRDLCRSVIPRHDGRIARIQGDGVLAIFGLPQAQEDDGRRATEAALELHEAVRRLSLRGGAVAPGSLDLHSGIHAGLVFLSDGDVERGRFEVLGNVPNTAARLSQLAERGDIVVSEETLGQDAGRFMLGEREVLAIRGRAPLAAFRVLGHAAARTR
ncbi:MAG: adenylate/guanylate cyclase domain-containing protein, partial [Rubrivivax sp.]